MNTATQTFELKNNRQGTGMGPGYFARRTLWDWLFAALLMSGAAWAFMRYDAAMDVYEKWILFGAVPSLIWLGWFWRPLSRLMAVVAALSLLAIWLYQPREGGAAVLARADAVFLLKYFISSQSAILWMRANTALLRRDLVGPDGTPATVAERVRRIEELGGPAFDNQVGSAWAWTDNTPFQYGKGIPAYLGGTRNPLVVSWPKGIKDRGTVRSQFSHATDIAPTIYELAGIPFPQNVEGVDQVPLAGRSLRYSFDQPGAASPRGVQYFEIRGSRGIYKDGWWAGSRQVNPGANSALNQAPFGTRQWELYNLQEDFTQSRNLAATHPEKLAELVAAFDKEAWANDVYPLQPDVGVGRASLTAGSTLFTYRAGVGRIPSRNGPDVTRRAHRISAELDLSGKGGDGVIIANGGRWGGFSLFVKLKKADF